MARWFAWVAGVGPLFAPERPALAADAPEVPEEALAGLSPDLHARWIQAEEQLAEMSRRIELARASEEGLSPGAIEDSRSAARAALEDAADLRIMAGSELEVFRLAHEQARLLALAARDDEEEARSALREARATGGDELAARERLARATEAAARARQAVVAARRDELRNAREIDARLDAADEALAFARQEYEASEALTTDEEAPRVGALELALLVARRDLVAAELEREQAAAAHAAGAALDLAPFDRALQAARDVEAVARQRLADEIPPQG